jgi:putative transposase
MARGFVQVAVVLDWFKGRVLAWRLSITMEAALCVETLEPDRQARFNTDPGSQVTGSAFIGVLPTTASRSARTARAWRDNVFLERTISMTWLLEQPAPTLEP